MGTLLAMHYPTKLFANLADHTYVRCGNGGKAWGCWGGKTGGNPLVAGNGSTSRADAIAQPNERANIKCYLVTGVCHQAANRILFPASVLVTGARGYHISESLFGPYGRPSGPFGFCSSPFDQYPQINGDLPECLAGAPQGMDEVPTMPKSDPGEAARNRSYIEGVMRIYAPTRGRPLDATPDADAALAMNLELFRYKMEFTFAQTLGKSENAGAMEARRSIEHYRGKLEEAYSNDALRPEEFARDFDRETIEFQLKMAEALGPIRYQQLFRVSPDTKITLADPSIIATLGDNLAAPL